MSVFTNVWRRKGIQKRFNNLTNPGRAQSPPSPASFVSPEIGEKGPFNPYSLYEATQSSASQHLQRQPSDHAESSKRASSPKVHIDFPADGLSLSEWFPSDLLQSRGDPPPPRPERNASLGIKTGSGSSALGVDGGHSRAASSSGHSHADTASNAGTGSISGLRSDAASSRGPLRTFAEDDIIVIEAPRGRDPTLSPLRASFNNSRGGVPDPSQSISKRPAPEPLKIPEPTALPMRRQRAISVSSLPLASSYPDEGESGDDNAPSSSQHPSASRSRHPSLSRSRSRLYSRSRPASTYSRYSDTEFDYDDINSAVSGTTLARELARSYIISPSSSISMSNGAQFQPRKGHLARQDSATLPRGELPFLYNRKSIRSSVRSSKSSMTTGSRQNSTYWRDRRISRDQIVLVSPEDRQRQSDSDVPPVPALPEGLSPDPSPFSLRSRKNSPNIESRRGSSAGLTAEWRQSNGGGRSAQTIIDPVPDNKRRRISRISEKSGNSVLGSYRSNTKASSSNTSLVDGVSGGEYDPVSTTDGYMEEPGNLVTHGNVSGVLPGIRSPPSHDIHDYDTPPLSNSGSVASADSTAINTPSSATGGPGARNSIARSFSDSSRKSMGPRPAPLIPVGERPRSSTLQFPLSAAQAQGPRSPSGSLRASTFMSPLQPPTMPAASNPSPESPDLLDLMFADSRIVQRSGGSSTRILSPPAPISVPPRDLPSTGDYGFLQDDPNSTSAAIQTFPETPYAFTPIGSAVFPTSALPAGTPPALPRTMSTAGRNSRGQKQGVARGALMRYATMTSPPSSVKQFSDMLPMTPPASANFSRAASHELEVDVGVAGHRAGILSAIEEASTPGSPMSAPSEYTNTPEHSPAPISSFSPARRALDVSIERPASLVPAKRSLTPLPSPPASSIPLPPSPLPFPAVQDLHPPPSPYASSALEGAVESREAHTPPLSPSPSTRPLNPLPTPPTSKLSRPEAVTGRRVLMRPPPPSGPRRPSGPQSLLSRSRGGSVSSSVGSPQIGATGSSSGHVTHGASTLSTGTQSASSPRFQTTAVKFRGLTMEAAQWTFTSEQLQETVSSAIKKSSDASSIRLLPAGILNEQIPEEILRLEAVGAELRTNYKLSVRKRKMLLGSLKSIADGGELSEQAASTRLLEDVAELSEHLDHISEELYSVMDQLGQLRHLQDVHFGSSLAMAVRKLNSKFIKHLTEKETLRQQVWALEAERDEAWRHAQQTAEEVDELNHKMALAEGIVSPGGSRRSSKVIIARKASVRRAGLRSPSHMRSQRSSLSNRNSMNGSPALRSASHGAIVPPVPPIPLRAPLGISTSDLPSRGSAITSETSPTSELRAMQQAQEELCEMLGISPEDLVAPPVENRPKRSVSLSAGQSPASPRSFLTRTNSEIYSPKETRRFLHRSRSIDDRTAVLASIGMSSASSRRDIY